MRLEVKVNLVQSTAIEGLIPGTPPACSSTLPLSRSRSHDARGNPVRDQNENVIPFLLVPPRGRKRGGARRAAFSNVDTGGL